LFAQQQNGQILTVADSLESAWLTASIGSENFDL